MATGAQPRARRLYVVRHGETERSARGVYSGRAEIALTEHGREQARATAERLAGAGVDAVWSSPLGRATETAAAIARATGAPLTVDERLTEVDYGPIEGMDRHEARERWGDLFSDWRADPYGAPLPGMEPLGDALARAREATADALAAAECPVLVGHQGILRLVLVAVGRIAPEEYFATQLREADPIEVDEPAILG